MKRFVLVLVSGLFAIPVMATPLPTGCYVTDEERSFYDEPPVCYVAEESHEYFTPATQTNSTLVALYGDIVANFIRQAYVSDTISINTISRQIALIKKLRRACGSKCSRIR